MAEVDWDVVGLNFMQCIDVLHGVHYHSQCFSLLVNICLCNTNWDQRKRMGLYVSLADD